MGTRTTATLEVAQVTVAAAASLYTRCTLGGREKKDG
jgi:hypothetical protein